MLPRCLRRRFFKKFLTRKRSSTERKLIRGNGSQLDRTSASFAFCGSQRARSSVIILLLREGGDLDRVAASAREFPLAWRIRDDHRWIDDPLSLRPSESLFIHVLPK